MPHTISSSILILLSFLSLSLARSCSFDYECGNVPYGYCAGGESDCMNTLEGFGLTTTSGGAGSVYYAQECRTDGQFNNYTFKKVPLAGGVPVDVYTRAVIPAPVNPHRILGLVDNYLFFDILRRYPGVGISSIDVTNPVKENLVYTDGYPQSAIELDPQSNTPATYVCNYNIYDGTYSIEKYSVFPQAGSVTDKGRLYNLPSNCGVIARHSDVDLFFTTLSYTTDTTTTRFYRGTILCANCTVPTPFFTVQERVVDFDVDGEYLFYGTASGLFRVNLDGTGNVKLSKDVEMAVAVAVVNGKVVYNNGMDIKSVDFQGNNFVLLSWNKVGACKCRSGFTGDNCDVCNGQVQWMYSGITQRPTCVPYDANGVPTSCSADYQCGNPPYTWCFAGKCTCWSANFTGPHCDVCASPRQVSWDSYGYPKCA